MRLLQILLITFIGSSVFGQTISFQSAYSNYPHLTPGILEAIAWNNTHMVHLNNYAPSCSGLPMAYGIMGLHDNGHNYFRENGQLVAQISGVSVIDQKASPDNQIMAYASAYNHFMSLEIEQGGDKNDGRSIRNVLYVLSEIPDSGLVNQLAMDMQCSEVLKFLMSEENSNQYQFPQHSFNLKKVFGKNQKVLGAKKVIIGSNGIRSKRGDRYTRQFKSIEYAPAIWTPAPPCNFSSRNGVAVSAVTIHTIQGSYAGAISWSQNCSSNVSYHYVIRSSDGQVTQMVLEADKGWHVGSENPYTIGYEHEGYVDDPSWYTQAMYNSSADLTRDVVNSGYGIPALRTYYGAASAVVNVLGNCTKIKGHQHYPNQTHTDPGINWDWEKYYKLINNNPSINTITTASGNFYDSGGPTGNYQDDERELWLIQPANAQSVSIDFTTFDLESGYDNLFIYDGTDTDSPLIGTYTGTNSPGQITSSGGSLLIEFRSDCATTAAGWEANYTSTLDDVIPPLTSIVAGQLWNTDDFTVDFTDSDGQSGVAQRFVLISEKSVADNGWNSNGTYGFTHEDFEDNRNNWTDATGTFTLTGNSFEFGDQNQQNSNSYALVDQDDSTDFLFHWKQTITSAGGNQRAGMHFFCDDPTLTNRGNSYFVYLRESNNTVQIYRVTNDVFSLESSVPLTIDQNVAYDCKTWYNPSSGWIKVYVNDSLISEWQDPSPLISGNSVSLRSGGCAVTFDDVRAYRSRGTQITVEAGPGESMSYESENASPTGRIISCIVDSAENWSLLTSEDYLLDFTSPTLSFLHDGNGQDIDTFIINSIEANWEILDIHSGVHQYEFAVGTLPNLDDVISWTNNGTSVSMSELLTSPVYDEVYHISVRATNNAGLISLFTSDGQRYIDDLGIDQADAMNAINIGPNPANNEFSIYTSLSDYNIALLDANGKVCLTKKGSGNSTIDVQHLSRGNYQLMITSGSLMTVKRVVIKH